jgi:hypothetical protein
MADATVLSDNQRDTLRRMLAGGTLTWGQAAGWLLIRRPDSPRYPNPAGCRGLLRRGLIERSEGGGYRVTEAGERALRRYEPLVVGW